MELFKVDSETDSLPEGIKNEEWSYLFNQSISLEY